MEHVFFSIKLYVILAPPSPPSSVAINKVDGTYNVSWTSVTEAER